MTPQEKAKEIVEKIKKSTSFKYQEYAGANYTTFEHGDDILINTAIAVVDEIIEQWNYIDTHISDLNGELNPNLRYWLDVKKELIKE
jgi:hypothetical protein